MNKIILTSFLIMALNSCSNSSKRQQMSNVRVVGNSNTLTSFQGPIRAETGLVLPYIDTLNNIATSYYGAITVRPQDNIIYISDGVKWRSLLNGTNEEKSKSFPSGISAFLLLLVVIELLVIIIIMIKLDLKHHE